MKTDGKSDNSLPTEVRDLEPREEFGPELWAKMVRRPHWALRILGWLFVLALIAGVVFMYKQQSEPGPEGGGMGQGRGGRTQDATAVRAVSIELGTITESGVYAGQVESATVDLAPLVSGRIEAVHVRIGERVEAGQEIARLDDREWRLQISEAEAQIEAATAARRRASTQREAGSRELERTRSLVADQIVSAQAVDSLQARLYALEAEVDAAAAQRTQARARIALLRQRLSECSVVAPFSGSISLRHREPGAFVQAGAPIIRLVAEDQQHVVFSVPEAEIALLAPGSIFTASAAATGQLEVPGVVIGIAREVSPQGRVVRVEGELAERPEAWLAGMYVEVLAVKRVLSDVAVVPARAVLTRMFDGTAEEDGVFLVQQEQARWTPVRVLGREAERVAIESAMNLEAQVLVSGHEDLSDGASIMLVGEPRDRDR